MGVLLWASGRGAGGQDRLCRALALAEALDARGLGARIALPAEYAGLGWLEAAGVRNPILLPEHGPELPHVLAVRGGADALVVDIDRPLSRAEARALSGGRPVAVIEGRGPGLAEVDIVVALERDARRSRALAGPAYVPLRRAVRLARELRGRQRPATVVVVRVDARDDEGDVARILAGVASARDAGVRLVGRVLADPCAPGWARLAGLARRLELSPPVPALPDTSLAGLAEADVAIVGSGLAVYEAVGCGVATIAVGGARGVAPLAAGGAVVGLPAGADEERVADAVRKLATSPGTRAALAAAGRALVDGLGAERVADRLIALLGIARTIDVAERRVG
jgi:glycosyltransferase involved in cell wall biosynthesis